MNFDVIKIAYELIKSELGRQSKSDNPPKTSIPLSFTSEGVLSSFCNIMGACLSNGYYGSKTIMCDMPKGKTRSRTILFSPENEIVGNYDSADWTAIRCALMAIISMEKFFGVDAMANIKVGYIGAGNINTWTAALMGRIHKNTENLVVGNPNNPTKTAPWPFRKSEIHTLQDLNETCDVIVSCTTATKSSEVVDVSVFSKPRLFVAQDTGYMFGPSFRDGIASFTDDPDSLRYHFRDEFPHDNSLNRIPHLGTLSQLSNTETKRAAVYLYGIALTDIAMAYAHHITSKKVNDA